MVTRKAYAEVEGRRARRRGRLVVAFAALVVFATVPAASAATATLRFFDAAGKEDPVAGVGRTLSVQGNAPSANTSIFIKFRNPGGAPCAPSAATDSGRYLGWGPNSYDQYSGGGYDLNGNFDLRSTDIWDTAGTYVFCIWMPVAGSSSDTVTPITQNVTFRAAAGTVSAAVSPAVAAQGQDAVVTVGGTTEAPTRVFAKYRAAGGAPCAPTPDADPGENVLDSQGARVDGTFSTPATISSPGPGSYVVCSWLASSSSGPVSAGPQSTTFEVAAPPPHCIVPSVRYGTSLATVKAQLAAANCLASPVRYAPSTRYARGTVTSVGAGSGADLGVGGAVRVVVSLGPPCVVPRVTVGRSIGGAQRQLRAAGCTPGSVQRVRSRRRSGTVVAYSPSSGRRLSPRARVTIYVSRGRR